MDDLNIFGPPKRARGKKDDIFGGGLNIGINQLSEKSEKKRRPIDKNIRHLVWTKYNKSSLSGKCYVCKTPITFQHFHVGHNKAVAKGWKDNINNLRPICSSCNNSMGTIPIEQYKAKYFGGKKPARKRGKKKSHIKKPKDDGVFGDNIFGQPPKRPKNDPFGF